VWPVYFQVQVAPESYPTDTQQFQLQQQVMMGKVDVSLGFDSSINHTLVTKDHARWMKLRR
jgi:hypothetical protein